MAGSKGVKPVKQRIPPAEKRRVSALATREKRKAYYARKEHILKKEPENYNKICLVEYEEGWWRMFDHSALLYK